MRNHRSISPRSLHSLSVLSSLSTLSTLSTLSLSTLSVPLSFSHTHSLLEEGMEGNGAASDKFEVNKRNGGVTSGLSLHSLSALSLSTLSVPLFLSHTHTLSHTHSLLEEGMEGNGAGSDKFEVNTRNGGATSGLSLHSLCALSLHFSTLSLHSLCSTLSTLSLLHSLFPTRVPVLPALGEKE